MTSGKEKYNSIRIEKSGEKTEAATEKNCFAGGSAGTAEKCNLENCMLCCSLDRPETKKPRLLLHSCCGPCSTSVIERLACTYQITVFFYNPNIHDTEEYEKRKKTQIQFLNQLNSSNLYEDKIDFIEGEYDPESFFEVSRGLEEEREGGARCEKCFILRLERTAVKAKTHGFDTFATTLTVSPYKNYTLIAEIGRRLAFQYGLSYLDIDFKKKDGYRRSIELSKQYGLYRQHYCGCLFSMPKTEGC